MTESEGPDPRGVTESIGWVPRPDPTVMTQQAVDRAITQLKLQLDSQFAAIHEATRLVREDYIRIIPAQVDRAVLSLREVLESKIDQGDINLTRIHDTINDKIASIYVKMEEAEKRRLDAASWSEKSIVVALEAQKTNTTSQMQLAIERVDKLDSVAAEQFARIATQFEERDKRTEQLSQTQKEATNALSLASSTAVAAALQAQKESAGAQNDSNAAAVAKSEAAFTKQIDQITVLVQQIQKGNDDKVSDLKMQIAQLASRLDRGEGNISGIEINRARERDARTEYTGTAHNGIAIISAVIAGLALVVTIFGSILWFGLSGTHQSTTVMDNTRQLLEMQRQLDKLSPQGK
jgi:hypothetical protein